MTGAAAMAFHDWLTTQMALDDRACGTGEETQYHDNGDRFWSPAPTYRKNVMHEVARRLVGAIPGALDAGGLDQPWPFLERGLTWEGTIALAAWLREEAKGFPDANPARTAAYRDAAIRLHELLGVTPEELARRTPDPAPPPPPDGRRPTDPIESGGDFRLKAVLFRGVPIWTAGEPMPKGGELVDRLARVLESEEAPPEAAPKPEPPPIPSNLTRHVDPPPPPSYEVRASLENPDDELLQRLAPPDPAKRPDGSSRRQGGPLVVQEEFDFFAWVGAIAFVLILFHLVSKLFS